MQPAYCVPAFDFCRVRVAAFAVGTATASAHPFLVSRVAYFFVRSPLCRSVKCCVNGRIWLATAALFLLQPAALINE